MSDTEEFELHCVFENQPASLERILRIVRVRGFALDRLNMQSEGTDCYCFMGLSGVRSIDNLICQLASLEQVISVYQQHHSVGTTAHATVSN